MGAREGGPELVKSVVGEIAAMEYAGDVKAVAAVVIDRDGDVRVMIAYNEGTKLAIVAGCAVLQRQVLDQMVTIEKRRD